MSTTKKTLFFHTSVDIENIQIDSFSFDPSSVEVNFLSNSNGVTNGVALEINSFNLYVTANCHYAAGIIGSSGDLSASTSGILFFFKKIFLKFITKKVHLSKYLLILMPSMENCK